MTIRILVLIGFVLSSLVPIISYALKPAVATVLPPTSTAADFSANIVKVTAALQNSPVMFIENVGQFDDEVHFQMRGDNRTIWLAEDALWITVVKPQTACDSLLPDKPHILSASINCEALSGVQNRTGVNIKLSFAGANPHPQIEPLDRFDAHVSYFIGNDANQWHVDAPVWSGARYVDLYPGIDLEIASEHGHVTQRIVAHASTDLSAVRLRVEGVDKIAAYRDRLHLSSNVGEFDLPLLGLTLLDDSISLPVGQIPFVNGNEIRMPFADASALRSYTTSSSDSSDLLYSTFLGGSGNDYGGGIAIDMSDAVYITGDTMSLNFPTTPGAFDPTFNDGAGDVFVVKINPAGTALIYATFLGGSDEDHGTDLAVDANGAAYLTGYTYSSDYPTTSGALDTTFAGGYGDAFVVKLNPTGTSLTYSTFLGGSGGEGGYGISVNTNGAAYVTGSTGSSDFPATSGAFDTTLNGAGDAFVAKLASTGTSLTYATLLGGSNTDLATGIAMGANDTAYITGYTMSSDFPSTPGAFDTAFNGGDGDVFVVKLNTMGTTLLYGTYVGGSGDDSGVDVAVDANGAAFVTGRTVSTDFPTTLGAFDTTFNGSFDTFAVKLDSAGTSLNYATFLGGFGGDDGNGVAVDANGAAYIMGVTSSADFPTTPGAFGTIKNISHDTFVVKLNSTGTALAYSTFLGGSGEESGDGIVVDAYGTAFVTGYTSSPDFPTTTGAFDLALNDGYDAFMAKLAIGLGDECYSTSTADTDGDSLPDGWEICGYDADGDGRIDVDLPAMGADPLHKDVFVEVDYMEGRDCFEGICITHHSHRPKQDAMAKVIQAFKDAPVGNPDETTGINLHVDFGADAPMKDGANWAGLSRANVVPHDIALSWSEFDALKANSAYFDPVRARIFHYVLFAHYYSDATNVAVCASGSGRMPGTDFIVSLAGWGSWLGLEECEGPFPGGFATGTTFQQAGTFMHELGHNLGLNHGGGDGVNLKPNYLSVMNYTFQTRGLIFNQHDAGKFDFSQQANIPTLTESHLYEAVGLNGDTETFNYGTRWTCPNGEYKHTLDANDPIDWDCDGNSSEVDMTANINNSTDFLSDPGEDLIGYADWAHIVFDGNGALGTVASATRPDTSTLPVELTLAQDSLIPNDYTVSLTGPGGILAPLGYHTMYTLTLGNTGRHADVYSLTASSQLGWADLSTVPVTLSLSSGVTTEFAIRVTIPTQVLGSNIDVVQVTATSTNNSALWNSAFIETRAILYVYLPLIMRP